MDLFSTNEKDLDNVLSALHYRQRSTASRAGLMSGQGTAPAAADDQVKSKIAVVCWLLA